MIKVANKVKITVAKLLTTKDVFGKDLKDEAKDGFEVCTKFKEGQEFIFDGTIPVGFCSWAWHDIQREATSILLGNSYPWMKKDGMGYFCCTDALRPVVFKLERIEG